MRSGAPFVDYTPDSCAEIYAIINARQLTALMFHDQMADYFRFLSLDGLSNLHERQCVEEARGRRKLRKCYMKRHNKLIEDWPVSNPKAIPDDWIKYTRMDVSSQVRTQSIQLALKKYREWEEESIALYSKCAKLLADMNYMADKQDIDYLITDVDEELKHLYEIDLAFKSANYDLSFVLEYQKHIK
jgi:hypothetical protein